MQVFLFFSFLSECAFDNSRSRGIENVQELVDLRVNERRRATALLARERELLEALMRSLQDGRRDHSKSDDSHTHKSLQSDTCVM